MILTVSNSITNLFDKGGFLMYPLVVLSILSVTLIIERLCFFGIRNYNLNIATAVIHGQQLPKKTTFKPLLKVIQAYLAQPSKEQGLHIASRVAEREIELHERSIKMLATIGNISPLIGLLGTVWGMVDAFAHIASLGENVTPADFAGGIWKGLLTTVAGLIVAIPAVTASRIFDAQVDKLTRKMNEVFSYLEESKLPSRD